MAKITSKNIESNIQFETNPRYDSNPSVDNDLSRKKYVDDQDALKVSKSGDTMSGELAMGTNKITGLANGTNPADAINYSQLQAAIEGMKPKESVELATTENITLSGEQTIDGVLTSGSRVLVKNQTDASENGIYVSASGAWTRAADMDVSSEVKGSYVPVSLGTTNQGRNFIQTGAFTTLDTDDINFTFFNSAALAHNHVAADITDFDTEVANNTAVAANTAKVSADGSVTTHNDVTDAGSGQIITSTERTKLNGIEAGAQVNADLASQAEAEAGVENTKTMTALRTAQAIAALSTSVTPAREVKTLSAGDISNGYVDLAQQALSNSVSVTPIGGIAQEPGVDFTESVPGSVTRITFAGDLLELAENDKLLIEYLY